MAADMQVGATLSTLTAYTPLTNAFVLIGPPVAVLPGDFPLWVTLGPPGGGSWVNPASSGYPDWAAFASYPGGGTAYENADGSGASYPITFNPLAGHTIVGQRRPVWGGSTVLAYVEGHNPTNRVLYLPTYAGTFSFYYLVKVPETLDPPTNIGPTVVPPVGPPAVVQRRLLDKANPGFTAACRRDNYLTDLGAILPGQRVNITANCLNAKLGMVNRPHLISQVDWTWEAHAQGGRVWEDFTLTAQIEKIPGSLLPGAGTSDSVQDDLGDGGILISIFALWDTVGAGWDHSGWAV